ncbi:unnamed protein product [Durusdinium trenchii]|uniref:PDZ domain-containing protein n=1 Tax=Durusdinium trenchii TaxID=1381693 RepID=A0ABP0MS75_9DINO
MARSVGRSPSPRRRTRDTEKRDTSWVDTGMGRNYMVSNGLHQAWNDKCLATGELDSVVRPGDLIISCNGVTKIEEMAQELFGSKKTLHIGLLREAGTKQKKRWLEVVQHNGQKLENAPEHLRSD